MPRQHIWIKNFLKHTSLEALSDKCCYMCSLLFCSSLSCQGKAIEIDDALAQSSLLLPCYNPTAPPSGTIAALPIETKDAWVY